VLHYIAGGVLVLDGFLLEAVEVELVLDEVLVDFAEEDVVLEAAEPLDPADVDVLAELRLLTHIQLIITLNQISNITKIRIFTRPRSTRTASQELSPLPLFCQI
jgi:hypothetical protein